MIWHVLLGAAGGIVSAVLIEVVRRLISKRAARDRMHGRWLTLYAQELGFERRWWETDRALRRRLAHHLAFRNDRWRQ